MKQYLTYCWVIKLKERKRKQHYEIRTLTYMLTTMNIATRLRPLTSGKCPCKYLIVSELLPTPPLPTTQTVSRLLDSTAWPLCAYSAIYTVPLVPKCSSRWVRIVSVGAGGPGQHAYGGRRHKLLSPSQGKFLPCENLSISLDLARSPIQHRGSGCGRVRTPNFSPTLDGNSIFVVCKWNQPNLLNVHKIGGCKFWGNTGIYIYIYI